ncbi:MAG: hypothetical protein PHS41_01700 [Victivallaceae bacterium]|nr:hypothetical protein [Victivallaceae bacterium]
MSDLIGCRKEEITLPSLLDGTTTASEWAGRRRMEILKLLENQMFGAIPPRPDTTVYETTSLVENVFDGLGSRREVAMHFQVGGKKHTVKALWYLPGCACVAPRSVPLIVGLNFKGNASCSAEPDLEINDGEIRGEQVSRWQIPFLLKQGFSLISAARNDFFPDRADGRLESIFQLFHPATELTVSHREYTAISAWAWGYMRLLELGETEPAIDSHCIWAHGHSRLGKTALWTAANDPRFAGTVSNDSGCCGMAIERDHLPEAEHFASIVQMFPWWFVPALDAYANKENAMPWDMHYLAALAAPRPLLAASASEDRWADPYNEFRCAKAIGEVYRLFGAQGLPDDVQFPAPEQPIYGDRVGYYLRTGKHDVTLTDWQFVTEFIRRNR